MASPLISNLSGEAKGAASKFGVDLVRIWCEFGVNLVCVVRGVGDDEPGRELGQRLQGGCRPDPLSWDVGTCQSLLTILDT
jgi:hypothetical protein